MELVHLSECTLGTSVGTYGLNLFAALQECDVNATFLYTRPVSFSKSRRESEGLVKLTAAGPKKIVSVPQLPTVRFGSLNLIPHFLNLRLQMKVHRAVISWTRSDLDVYHFLDIYRVMRLPSDLSRRASKTAMVFTFYHLDPILDPTPRRLYLLYTPDELKILTKRRCLILTISNNTKKDLEKIGMPQERIKVVYPGVDHGIFRPPVDGDLFGGRERFVLSVAVSNPRKNKGFLLDVFRRVSMLREDLKLVLVGYNRQDVLLADSLGIRKRVVFLRDLKLDELVELYQRAALFLHTSTYEGFGFPILEAMACGCPVLAFKSSSVPEIIGDDGGMLLDDLDPDRWARTVLHVLSEESLRLELARRGYARSLLFTWERSASEVLHVYQEASSLPA